MKQLRDAAVTVYPEEDNFASIAKALLAAADHPNQVRSVSHPKAGFEVPLEVFDRFEAAQGRKDEPAFDPGDAVTEPSKRRPGRPRKNAEPQGPVASDASKEE